MITTRTQPRRGFTLIEMLVVIAIIVVLVGLTASGVLRFYASANRVANQNDMNELSKALAEFKQKYSIYPPSRVLLSNDPAQYLTHPLAQESLKSLTRIWPRIRFTTAPPDWAAGQHPSQQRALAPGEKYAVVLEGDQCLVFFLGGVQDWSTGETIGFTDSPSNPISSGTRQKPFFDFKPTRLYQRTISVPNIAAQYQNPTRFYSYKDVYEESPWVYFSSGTGVSSTSTYGDHCPSLGSTQENDPTKGLIPYKKAGSTGLFHSSKSFQLISAGEDARFGFNNSNNVYNPNNPAVFGAGRDDITNFHPVPLGVAAE